MIEYPRFDYDEPIIKQFGDRYRSGAFLLHPFVQMPEGWTKSKRESPRQHIYPSNEEILNGGKPVSWEEVRRKCQFASLNEVGIALSSLDVREEFKRKDLEEKLAATFSEDFYWPMEDSFSIFLCEGILRDFASNGSYTFFFSEPVEDASGQRIIETCKPLELPEIGPAEIMLTDDSCKSVFISQYDRYTTLFLSKENNIQRVIDEQIWESVNCRAETKVLWFLE